MNVSLGGLLGKVRGVLRAGRIEPIDQIPQVPLNEIVNGPVIRVDGLYSYAEGSLPWCDILALMSVLVDRSPRSILEIGTFDGYTTRLMALNLPGAEIHTIDLPEGFVDTGTGLPKDDAHLIAARQVGRVYKSDPTIHNVKQYFGDSAEFPFPAVEAFFIDGAHTYDYVHNDTEKALAAPGAKLLIWHDCNADHPGVVKWLVEMIQTGRPVRRIVGTNLAVLDLANHSAR